MDQRQNVAISTLGLDKMSCQSVPDEHLNCTITNNLNTGDTNLIPGSILNRSEFNVGKLENMSFSELCKFFKLDTDQTQQKLEIALNSIINLLECLDSKFNINTQVKGENRLCFLIKLMLKFNEIFHSSNINLNRHDILKI